MPNWKDIARRLTTGSSGGWVIVPKSDSGMRVYIAGTCALYVIAAATFLLEGNTASPYLAFSGYIWGAAAALVACLQVWAFIDMRYGVFRLQAISAAMWASAYEVNLLYAEIQTGKLSGGLAVWSWVVLIHFLLVRYRLTQLTAATVTASTIENTREGAERLRQTLQQSVDAEDTRNSSS